MDIVNCGLFLKEKEISAIISIENLERAATT
jgi:hypothetical protein